MLVMAGLAVVTAAPASATAGNTGLGCSAATATCTFSDPEGVRTVQFSSGGSFVTSDTYDCTGTVQQFVQWNVPSGSWKVFVTDCENPRSHATFDIHPDYKIVVIRNN
ncbi:MAG: hypothetical protein QOF30_344 [Acidimicrobiaceae bacterium]|jgi:hypothetical protein|nr:hypothetical protein [Acidimicrobiaceae bacterium]